jgi:PhnB protein
MTIDTDHLTLGVMRACGPMLGASFRLTTEAQGQVRQAIERRTSGGARLSSSHEIPFSPAAKQALDLSAGEADALGHRHIGCEHLLLGLLRGDDGSARDLAAHGLTLGSAREVARTLTGADRAADLRIEDALIDGDAEAGIRQLRDNLTEAIRRKDVAATLACFAPRPVMFLLSPPLQFAGDGSPGRLGVEEWFASFDGPIGYEVRDFTVVANANVGFCHSLIHISGQRADGTTMALWLRETLGVGRVDDAWRIMHQHQSIPVREDGRAAADLEP